MQNYATPLQTEAHYAQNPFILRWWKNEHDQLVLTEIQRKHWIWFWDITEKITEITPSQVIEQWRAEDPLCKHYAWYNVIMYFTAARVKQLGFTQFVRSPQQKICAGCNKIFSEASIPPSVVKYLGIDRIDVCNECIRYKLGQGSGSDTLTKQEIIRYLRNLVDVIQVIPSQNFGETLSSLTNLSTEQRVAVLKIHESKPTIKHVKDVFGSWLNALIQAELLEDSTRQTSRGIQCLAQDGHLCLSLGEKTIDDYLYRHEIAHQKEPKYPEGNYRGDFLCGNVMVEYFGLTGDLDYDEKTKEKMRLCKRHNVFLIAIYPEDLVIQDKLGRKLSILQTKRGG
jgi:hypothetical protein